MSAVSNTHSHRRRALLAVLVLVGFYVLSLGVVGSLITASVMLHMTGGSLALLDITTIATTVAVVPAVFALDRRVRDFRRQGCLAVSREEQPQLWRLVEELASAAGSEPPASLLISADTNAGVLQTGSFLGLLPGRRTMVLGLPLVAALSENQLRAVLAHEFGHYLGGDTRVGAVLYRASVGLNRARLRLAGSFTGEIFDDYASFFERIALPIMRDQEVAADRLAASVTSEQDLRQALATLPGADALWLYHLEHYLLPAWERGLSVADPFTSMMQQWEGRAWLRDRALAEALASRPSPHDSHPPLSQRLEALGSPGPRAAETKGCLDLVNDVEALESALRRNFTPPAARAFARRDVAFQELPQEVGAALGLERAETLLKLIERMKTAESTSPGGSLGHLLDLLAAGEAESIHRRVLSAGGTRENDVPGLSALSVLVRMTLAHAMVDQGMGDYELQLEGDEPFRVVQKHKTPLDLVALSEKAVASGAGALALRKALTRRGVDLTWAPPGPDDLEMSALAGRIAGG